jgi:hypothetical protein
MTKNVAKIAILGLIRSFSVEVYLLVKASSKRWTDMVKILNNSYRPGFPVLHFKLLTFHLAARYGMPLSPSNFARKMSPKSPLSPVAL